MANQYNGPYEFSYWEKITIRESYIINSNNFTKWIIKNDFNFNYQIEDAHRTLFGKVTAHFKF